MIDSPCRAQTDNIVISVCLVALLGLGTFSRNIDWQDSLRLWRSASEIAPKHARPRLNIAHELLKRQDFQGAREQYHIILKNIQIDRTPLYQSNVRATALSNLVLLSIIDGRELDRVEGYLKIGLAERPNDPYLLVNRGLIRTDRGQCEEAKQDFIAAHVDIPAC